MNTLFWILVFIFALVAAWRVILMSATFPLPPKQDEQTRPDVPRRRRRPQNV